MPAPAPTPTAIASACALWHRPFHYRHLGITLAATFQVLPPTPPAPSTTDGTASFDRAPLLANASTPAGCATATTCFTITAPTSACLTHNAGTHLTSVRTACASCASCVIVVFALPPALPSMPHAAIIASRLRCHRLLIQSCHHHRLHSRLLCWRHIHSSTHSPRGSHPSPPALP